MSNVTDSRWHIIYVRDKGKKTLVYLLKKGIEFFYPFQEAERTLYNIKTHSGETVLAGYIFVKISAEELHRLKSAPGVLNIVYWLDKPASIRDEDISAFQAFLNSHPVSRIEKVRPAAEARTMLTNIFRDNRGSDPAEFITCTSILEFPAIGYAFIAENMQVDVASYPGMQNRTPTTKALPALNT